MSCVDPRIANRLTTTAISPANRQHEYYTHLSFERQLDLLPLTPIHRDFPQSHTTKPYIHSFFTVTPSDRYFHFADGSTKMQVPFLFSVVSSLVSSIVVSTDLPLPISPYRSSPTDLPLPISLYRFPSIDLLLLRSPPYLFMKSSSSS